MIAVSIDLQLSVLNALKKVTTKAIDIHRLIVMGVYAIVETLTL
jgi:hypothetical protein